MFQSVSVLQFRNMFVLLFSRGSSDWNVDSLGHALNMDEPISREGSGVFHVVKLGHPLNMPSPFFNKGRGVIHSVSSLFEEKRFVWVVRLFRLLPVMLPDGLS